ncbi:MAG: Na(+)-translocating NADH-quinone reductase subunit C [Planctomycetes bacterium]|nr:Na(+)-translocating NADH-quinone reductase subunit C [Planctomycetota bacterium]
MARDSVGHTLTVATILCVVCSVLVSSAAVGLRSRQEANKAQDQMKNVLVAAGLFDEKENTAGEVNAIFADRIERVLIDLETGELADPNAVDAETYDQREAARKPDLSAPVQPPDGLGGIKRREKYAFVYEVRDDSGQVEQVVLPIYGKGLWSTLYGFIAVDKDGTTVRGITFYEHGETPGLGGEVDNPRWKALWKGKQLFDESGQIEIEVIKGVVVAGTAKAQYQIDGLSGATITSNGVEQLVRYWVGPDGFGPFLEKLRQSAPGGIDG